MLVPRSFMITEQWSGGDNVKSETGGMLAALLPSPASSSLLIHRSALLRATGNYWTVLIVPDLTSTHISGFPLPPEFFSSFAFHFFHKAEFSLASLPVSSPCCNTVHQVLIFSSLLKPPLASSIPTIAHNSFVYVPCL